MWISRLVCLFVIYSFFGWVYESIYCTMKNGHWENRGFLYGPCCPIYGVGAILISFFAVYIPGEAPSNGGMIFTIAFFGSMVLEYTTSLVLELLFHAVWWDYSDLPLNIKGRTSVLTSIGFGFAGILVVNRIAPAVESAVDGMSMIVIEAVSLLFVAVFAADLALTVSALTNFGRIVTSMEDAFNERMESIVVTAQKKTDSMRHFIALESMGEMRKLALKRVTDFRYPHITRESVRQLIESLRK